MNAQDCRNAIIEEEIPKLVKLLTGFDNSNENLKICEDFALSSIQQNKYLSVNSHEIRRQIENLAERFRISNNPKHERRLQELCNYLIQHPVCDEHYETDIQWSILTFLFGIARNPINNLAQIDEQFHVDDENAENERMARDKKDYWAKLLQTDNIVVLSDSTKSDSELSAWSDSDEDIECENVPSVIDDAIVVQNADVNPWSSLPGIKPPEKMPHSRPFDPTNASSWLLTNIQNCWWKGDWSICKVNSSHKAATFLRDTKSSLGRLISSTSEYCLLREILWMFVTPITCKYFFKDKDQIIVNRLAPTSLNSMSLSVLQSFLDNFCHYITITYKLRSFYNAVINEPESPVTYQCFAEGMKQCLQPLYDYLIKTETKLIEQKIDRTSMTVIQLYTEMDEYFVLLNHLNEIYTNCILDYKSIPFHICATYLLSGLLNETNVAANTKHANLAATLFLSSVQIYLKIIDVWWTRGKLEDFKNEFLLEKQSNSGEQSNAFVSRINFKSKSDHSSYDAKILTAIKRSSFINLLTERSMQAGYALNILFKFDKISDIKQFDSHTQENLYESFVDMVMAKLKKFQYKNSTATNSLESEQVNSLSNEFTSQDESSINNSMKTDNSTEIDNSSEIDNSTVSDTSTKIVGVNEKNLENLKLFQKSLLNKDTLLYLVFENGIKDAMNRNQLEDEVNNDSDKQKYNNALNVFEILNKLSPLQLPFDEIVLEILTELLKLRICATNNCVMSLYTEEFQIMHHLKAIRKVYLFEASDLMYHFSANLFKQIESGENWKNPYLLTVQLNDFLASKLSNSLFTVEICQKNYKPNDVLDAIMGIIIHYNANEGLQEIVDEKCFAAYNQVFRFLLKIKWGLWTLENLQFPKSMKKRQPYMPSDQYDLTFRRLALARHWIIYAISCVHSHLMTQILQFMGQKLDEKILKLKNLNDVIDVHRSYVKAFYEHCFQKDSDSHLRSIVNQFLNLIVVLKDEWRGICLIKNSSMDDDIDGDFADVMAFKSQIDDIENTYISIHHTASAVLTSEVYTKNRYYLDGLAAAFHCSSPF